jgi:Uma2 family endonuclease
MNHLPGEELVVSTILAPPPGLPSVSPPESRVGDESLYEVIDGQRVELPPMSAFAARIAFLLGTQLHTFGVSQNLGEGAVETLFRLPLVVGRNRRPDVAFVTYQRWARGRPIPPRDNAWDVVPDLAVEVISPTDVAEELMTKVQEYFQAGVRLVWVVYPLQGFVHVYEALTQIRGLTRADELDGGQVLPGFRLPLATLFPQEQASSE